MNTGRRALLLLLMVVGLTAASLVAIAVKPATLGLDLQGGVEVVLEGRQASADAPVNAASINRSVEVIRNRVDAFGVAEPEIQTAGSNQIVVALPGADDPNRVVNDLIKPAQLAFYDFIENRVNDTPNPSLYATVKQAQKTNVADPSKGVETLYAFKKRDNAYVAGPVVVSTETGLTGAKQDLKDLVQAAGLTMKDVAIEAVPRGLTIVRQVEQLQTRSGAGRDTYYIFQDRPGLTGRDIKSAASIRDVGQGRSGEPIVTMQFTGAGQGKFRDITRGLAQRGSLDKQLYTFAIVLDGELISNPSVDYKEYPFGIDGSNGAQIQGNFSAEEARTLASQLNSGAIPIRLEVVSQKQVSATLGKESLRKGLIAGLVGLVLVLAFMLGYYRLLGVVAALGLLIYAALFYAVIVLVPITLTLPGIAGVILTIGISSDANVVIFERVREEARSGKSPSAALAAGYKKGLAAIVDANVVTFFTAVIVFLFATAGPRGFAFTLGIGVLLSLFTAVFATRAIFGVLLGSRFMREERVMALKQGRVFTFDWVGRWKLWIVASTIPVLFGLVWLTVGGLNLGLDFKSGTRISVAFEKPATESGIRGILAAQGLGDAKVQATTEQIAGKDVRGFQIQTAPLAPDAQQKVQRALDSRYTINKDSLSLEKVGPTFGRQIIRNAIYAVILSFFIVALYLIIRFEYKLALPAMLSVVHDVALSLGIYAVTGREVTSATVAALLTILGYSLYDVVIVFDRIRENAPLMRGRRYKDIVNLSVNETITRSVITSLTTLLPVLALFFFGGDTLKDFSFALLVGILSGGVSSIVIAAPLASWWKERDPEQVKRAARAERRRQRIDSDADVVDLAVLERAELSLEDVPLDQVAGLIGEGNASIPPEESQPPRPVHSAVTTTEETPAPSADDEADYEPLDAPAPAAGDTAPEKDAGPRGPRERTTPERQRRHSQVQRRRKR